MKFNSSAGQELRTWILFFVGIGLAVIFALKGNPLNPWWTLVIGAFTCTAIIVSAVNSLYGGLSDAAKKAINEERRNDPSLGSEVKNEPTLSIDVGYRFNHLVRRFRRHHTVAIQ